jgi:lipoprotein-anchoring transpeptidase ErfK/SrfK
MSGKQASVGFSRRQFLSVSAVAAASGALSACTTAAAGPPYGYFGQPFPTEPSFGNLQEMYGSVVDEGFELPAIPVEQIDPQFLRQIVQDPTGEAPGTVVVDTQGHFLYFVRPYGQAIRYGVGLGRAGFEWSGRAVIQWKKKWPRWKVPAEMVGRQPELAKYSVEAGGMEPGLKNPLGARALYIFQNNVDTLYRIHGSPEWWTIGKSVSSGCVRMINQDVIDLYNRVANQTPVLVY